MISKELAITTAVYIIDISALGVALYGLTTEEPKYLLAVFAIPISMLCLALPGLYGIWKNRGNGAQGDGDDFTSAAPPPLDDMPSGGINLPVVLHPESIQFALEHSRKRQPAAIDN